MHMERERERRALNRQSLKLRAGAAFWSAVSAMIVAYLAVITFGGRTCRPELSRGEIAGGRRHG